MREARKGSIPIEIFSKSHAPKGQLILPPLEDFEKQMIQPPVLTIAQRAGARHLVVRCCRPYFGTPRQRRALPVLGCRPINSGSISPAAVIWLSLWKLAQIWLIPSGPRQDPLHPMNCLRPGKRYCLFCTLYMVEMTWRFSRSRALVH
jgi:hypothetical protein